MTVKQYTFPIYYTGLLLLAAGTPIWMLLMSISQIIILCSWILDGDLKAKFKTAFTNPVVLVITGLFAIHLLGLLNTSDFDYALRDLRIKMPLVMLPIVVSTMPRLNEQQFNNVLKVLIAATLISSLCSIAVLMGFTSIKVDNIRDISLFISHIRFALIICVCIASLVYLINKKNKSFNTNLYILLIIWFIIFLVILESLTGIFILICLLFVYVFSILRKKQSGLLRSATIIFFLLLLTSSGLIYKYLFIDSVKPLKVDARTLKTFTALGHEYFHLPKRQDTENGNAVWININEEELDSCWNKRSSLNYKGNDFKGQAIKYTLIRYMTSKNLTKDAEGMKQLTVNDIRAVENGIPNINYIYKSNLSARLQQLAWEYRNYYFSGNPSGHSAMQRLEFWKTALFIIHKNPLTGVGTGDVQQEFNKAYVIMKSQLLPQFRFHSHNEYLTMTVAFGIGGGLYFIFSLLFPFIYLHKKNDFLYTAFFLILLISMLTEDTPETQAGVTFMAFFNALFLFHDYGKSAAT